MLKLKQGKFQTIHCLVYYQQPSIQKRKVILWDVAKKWNGDCSWYDLGTCS